jgi:hypothetical protein
MLALDSRLSPSLPPRLKAERSPMIGMRTFVASVPEIIIDEDSNVKEGDRVGGRAEAHRMQRGLQPGLPPGRVRASAGRDGASSRRSSC